MKLETSIALSNLLSVLLTLGKDLEEMEYLNPLHLGFRLRHGSEITFMNKGEMLIEEVQTAGSAGYFLGFEPSSKNGVPVVLESSCLQDIVIFNSQ